MTKQVDIATHIKIEILKKFGRLSFAQLAREIEAKTGRKTTRGQVHGVVSGRLSMKRVKQDLAVMLGVPIESLWPTSEDES